MVLIGMMDSPYVRRVAVSMKLMDLAFEHRAVSVFRQFEEFRAVNPVVKAPSLVCDDGLVLMDSTLILDYLEQQVASPKRLMPEAGAPRREALRLTGLALAACDKCVQIVYEKEQRPAEKRHRPWLERVVGQANAAFAELERAAGKTKGWLQGERLNAADVVVACAWRFGQHYNYAEVPAPHYPALGAHSDRAEALPEFVSSPLP
ncbi:MAG TPA: glutathione S-transferase [Usitatibacter sp.]|nr:glutathione S-transferase [Usitatibacter sp.]